MPSKFIRLISKLTIFSYLFVTAGSSFAQGTLLQKNIDMLRQRPGLVAAPQSTIEMFWDKKLAIGGSRHSWDTRESALFLRSLFSAEFDAGGLQRSFESMSERLSYLEHNEILELWNDVIEAGIANISGNESNLYGVSWETVKSVYLSLHRQEWRDSVKVFLQQEVYPLIKLFSDSFSTSQTVGQRRIYLMLMLAYSTLKHFQYNDSQVEQSDELREQVSGLSDVDSNIDKQIFEFISKSFSAHLLQESDIFVKNILDYVLNSDQAIVINSLLNVAAKNEALQSAVFNFFINNVNVFSRLYTNPDISIDFWINFYMYILPNDFDNKENILEVINHDFGWGKFIEGVFSGFKDLSNFLTFIKDKKYASIVKKISASLTFDQIKSLMNLLNLSNSNSKSKIEFLEFFEFENGNLSSLFYQALLTKEGEDTSSILYWQKWLKVLSRDDKVKLIRYMLRQSDVIFTNGAFLGFISTPSMGSFALEFLNINSELVTFLLKQDANQNFIDFWINYFNKTSVTITPDLLKIFLQKAIALPDDQYISAENILGFVYNKKTTEPKLWKKLQKMLIKNKPIFDGLFNKSLNENAEYLRFIINELTSFAKLLNYKRQAANLCIASNLGVINILPKDLKLFLLDNQESFQIVDNNFNPVLGSLAQMRSRNPLKRISIEEPEAQISILPVRSNFAGALFMKDEVPIDLLEHPNFFTEIISGPISEILGMISYFTFKHKDKESLIFWLNMRVEDSLYVPIFTAILPHIKQVAKERSAEYLISSTEKESLNDSGFSQYLHHNFQSFDFETIFFPSIRYCLEIFERPVQIPLDQATVDSYLDLKETGQNAAALNARETQSFLLHFLSILAGKDSNLSDLLQDFPTGAVNFTSRALALLPLSLAQGDVKAAWDRVVQDYVALHRVDWQESLIQWLNAEVFPELQSYWQQLQSKQQTSHQRAELFAQFSIHMIYLHIRQNSPAILKAFSQVSDSSVKGADSSAQQTLSLVSAGQVAHFSIVVDAQNMSEQDLETVLTKTLFPFTQMQNFDSNQFTFDVIGNDAVLQLVLHKLKIKNAVIFSRSSASEVLSIRSQEFKMGQLLVLSSNIENWTTVSSNITLVNLLRLLQAVKQNVVEDISTQMSAIVLYAVQQ